MVLHLEAENAHLRRGSGGTLTAGADDARLPGDPDEDYPPNPP
jgi:hypothetical protein